MLLQYSLVYIYLVKDNPYISGQSPTLTQGNISATVNIRPVWTSRVLTILT